MMLLGIALTFTSCKKDETTVAAPTVTVNGGNTSIELDLAITKQVTIDIKAVAGTDRTIKTLTIDRAIPGSSTIKIYTASPDKNEVTYSHQDSIAGMVSANVTVTYSITATDNKDLVTTQIFTVKFIQTNNILTSSTVVLGAQSNTTVEYKFLGIANNFASYTAGATGTAKANSEKIDFVYYYGNTDKNSFASPTNTDGAQVIWSSEIASWTTKNDTKFKATTITASQFDVIKDNTKVDDSFKNIDFNTATVSKMTDLKNNDVISFQTASGKKGLIKFLTTASDNQGSATLVVISQD